MEEPTTMAWRVHPASTGALRLLLVCAAVAALGAIVAVIQNDWIWGAGTTLVLVGVLNRFFLPSSFEVDAIGVTGKYPLRTNTMKWSEVVRHEIGPSGCLVSNRMRRPWGSRGELVIPFSSDQTAASAQRAFVAAHLALSAQAREGIS